ncbi:hypothetical protein [Winogradskyella aurantia]|uniref:Uncharacterized protein n=1 Tax=Winogradskyella aurantia TaxID=1915063 RepID=A0A265UXS8_9FLAO|nr:hypothetical protein [Winogradskyella aurantia]OZV70115.1 hypothetical protein CA834_05720 [Winogradskyella aurantia]
MKRKNKKPFLNMDERNKQIAFKVIAVMYFLTIIAMQGIVIYRQFSLGQNIGNFEDIAIIMTINSIFLISALLYFGALPIRKLKVKNMILIYLGFVILGSVFTFAKYNIFQSQVLTLEQVFDKLKIIAAIIGLLMGFWILLSFLGKKRIDKELE